MKISWIKSSLILIFEISIFLNFSTAAYAAGKAVGPTIIQYQSKDGFNIAGVLDVPKNASVNKKAPLVIFLHSLGGSKSDWGTFPNSVKSLGYATLALDLRGHGLSILDKKNKKKYWPNFKQKEYSKYSDDVNMGIKYLKDNYPEINANKVAIIGANIGADTAILAGSKSSSNIKTLILMSPFSHYKGIDARIPLVEYGTHPVLILVSKSDHFVYNDSSQLIKYAQGKKQLKVYPFGGNGISLLKFQPASKTVILDWLKANFK